MKMLQRSRVTTDADAPGRPTRPTHWWRASTEPRHDGRGCARSTVNVNGRPTLQRSRVTTDADAPRFERCARSTRTASTEPRHDGRGCDIACQRNARLAEASTEPRHDGRGCGSHSHRAASGTTASTEPRHDGRGCVLAAVDQRLEPLLQRSRVTTDADAFPTGSTHGFLVALQRSRVTTDADAR